ncbi:MAG: glycosyltransferase family 4 protein [Phycisphaerae bacterium]
MRILFLSHFFQPEPNFFMCLPFAKELARRGHTVEVLTGFPNYPGGKIYPGYRIKVLQREILEGIPINRVPLYPSHDNSSIKRMLCYTSFAISASTIGVAAVKTADVVYVDQGPITVGLPACVLKSLKGIPFVLHVHDLWPDSLFSTGMLNNTISLKIVSGWCNFVYKRATKIVAITPGMKQRLIERGVPKDKIEVILNWCDDLQICHTEPNGDLAGTLGMAGRFNIVFAGNMGRAQALSPVLDAAKIVGERQSIVQFVFIGGGVEVDALKQKAVDLGLKNVLFLPRRPVSEIGTILSLADVLFVHLKNDPLFAITIPSKTQAYMAAGRPVLIGVQGDAADLITKANAGLPCEPEDPQSIAQAVLKLQSLPRAQLDAMGRNGKAFYDEQLSFSLAVDKFEKIFKTIAQKGLNE